MSVESNHRAMLSVDRLELDESSVGCRYFPSRLAKSSAGSGKLVEPSRQFQGLAWSSVHCLHRWGKSDGLSHRFRAVASDESSVGWSHLDGRWFREQGGCWRPAKLKDDCQRLAVQELTGGCWVDSARDESSAGFQLHPDSGELSEDYYSAESLANCYSAECSANCCWAECSANFQVRQGWDESTATAPREGGHCQCLTRVGSCRSCHPCHPCRRCLGAYSAEFGAVHPHLHHRPFPARDETFRGWAELASRRGLDATFRLG